jgi:small subunit ribosomal protein S20
MLTNEEKKNQEKQTRNRKYKTLIKNQFKKIDTYLKGDKKNPEELKKMISEAQRILDKAKNKKVIHRNKVSRKKSQLHSNLNGLKEEKK